jgi:hypothetical protein
MKLSHFNENHVRNHDAVREKDSTM